MIMELRPGSDHGLAVVQKTKTTDHPHGMAWKIAAAVKKNNKPKVKETDTELIKLMAKKVSNAMFARLIIKSLNQSLGQDLETICNKINEIQCLT